MHLQSISLSLSLSLSLARSLSLSLCLSLSLSRALSLSLSGSPLLHSTYDKTATDRTAMRRQVTRTHPNQSGGVEVRGAGFRVSDSRSQVPGGRCFTPTVLLKFD